MRRRKPLELVPPDQSGWAKAKKIPHRFNLLSVFPIEVSLMPTGQERILLIDDEEILVELGKQMLEYLGYQVTARTSSLQALELFKNQADRFDLVITDHTMPQMTGLDLSKALTDLRPGIPIILCTGFSETITPQKVQALGIRELYNKEQYRLMGKTGMLGLE